MPHGQVLLVEYVENTVWVHFYWSVVFAKHHRDVSSDDASLRQCRVEIFRCFQNCVVSHEMAGSHFQFIPNSIVHEALKYRIVFSIDNQVCVGMEVSFIPINIRST